LIERLARVSPNTVPIFTSEVDSAGHTVKAFRAGAFDVVHMPTSFNRLEAAIERALVQNEMRSLRDNYQKNLESEIWARTAELERAVSAIERSYRSTLHSVVRALEKREREPEGHCERMITFSLRLGFEIGLGTEALRDLELGTLLHDVGMIGVADDILLKPEPLTESEWSAIRKHTIYGHEILRGIPFLEGAARIVAEHHECWDGSGYPRGLRGEEIDIGARILAVVDAFDAMTSERVFRKGRGYKDAVLELERYSGRQFDPMVVEAFRRIPADDWDFLRERSLLERPEQGSLRAVVSELVYSRRDVELVH
jgi:HD-GYP domain-containing protein (c-di-GMP phosphodiesterase class II)